ncbi:MAG TPA: HNH endonuclease signature motif containing protein, partial [Sporichthyaceae bacterium]|nr:HNH endonuclease signature motif containing protein [Sporichthyaceae bacterium]
QWTALVIRDGGCVFPQCDRPPDLCEGHHIIPWIPHGPTDIDNLALACFNHHDFAHQGWQVHMGPDGHPEVIPPPWADPQQRPRRNEYWRIQRQLTLGLDLPRD